MADTTDEQSIPGNELDDTTNVGPSTATMTALSTVEARTIYTTTFTTIMTTVPTIYDVSTTRLTTTQHLSSIAPHLVIYRSSPTIQPSTPTSSITHPHDHPRHASISPVGHYKRVNAQLCNRPRPHRSRRASPSILSLAQLRLNHIRFNSTTIILATERHLPAARTMAHPVSALV